MKNSDRRKKSPVVGLLASYPLPPNMQAVLYNLGRMMLEECELQLIMGPEKLPKQLQGLMQSTHVEPPPVPLHGLGFPLKAIFTYVRRYQPDVLMNVGQTYPLGVAVITAGKMYGIRTILRVTEDYLAEAKVEGTASEKVWRQLFHGTLLHYAIYRQADTVIPVGRRLARKLVRAGMNGKKVHHLPQPFDANIFERSSALSKTKYKKEVGLEENRRTILNVGRMSWGKGADRTLKIIKKVIKRNKKDFQFCLVGDGPYMETFSDLPPEHVYTAGKVERKEVHKYFKAADLLIHPSRREALPNVILEAIAARVPIIASPVGDIPEYVDSTTEDPGEYAKYILNKEWNPEKIPKWYNWEVQKNKYNNIINKNQNINDT
ncbi:glycosyltransferase involved in cell wall biosynthesis [Salinibacter ruber]|jgi:glycosyltransferase involved in cell wall biosynthesis|uniref:glycosyltransferase family 4 protein n=1 Tax=Salinibacter ruber TaxID=146919 RepID=UPI002169F8B7|nr:glycosyltransferase family 4 protein [Salinibacter ruber]MCS3650588.1 glycosyltransferase involved in cell wall biosynthesis [Salinibacter ruber]MCS3653840.1 glycosyltransferase involved in cell wall biosynthesis [Salinibacter ruber]